MYTGAFAFPDSASLEISQPALDLPHKSGRGQGTTAARPAARGKAARAAAGSQGALQGKEAAPADAGKEAAPAVKDGSAAAAKDATRAGLGAGASSSGSPRPRVMPSGWKKKKKVDPLAEAPAGLEAEAATGMAEAATHAAVALAMPPASVTLMTEVLMTPMHAVATQSNAMHELHCSALH